MTCTGNNIREEVATANKTATTITMGNNKTTPGAAPDTLSPTIIRRAHTMTMASNSEDKALEIIVEARWAGIRKISI
jgi:hypothetical protein